MINELYKKGMSGSSINGMLIGTSLFVTKTVGQLLKGC